MASKKRKQFKMGEKIDSQDPDNAKKWITATIIHETNDSVQIHYDDIGEELHDEYVTDSDEDDWILLPSNKIDKLHAKTATIITLSKPIHIDNNSTSLIFIDELNIILYPAVNFNNIMNEKTHFIQSYHIDSGTYSVFSVYPETFYEIDNYYKNVIMVFDQQKHHLYVLTNCTYIFILDVMTKKWIKTIQCDNDRYIEFDTIKNTMCYLCEPIDELHVYRNQNHGKFDMNTKQWIDISNVTIMEDDDDFIDIDSKESIMIYNQFQQKLLIFNLEKEFILFCDITSNQQTKYEWKSYGIRIPYPSLNHCYIVPTFKNEIIFFFYFEQNNNEIWCLDAANYKLYKSEKHFFVNGLVTDSITMVQANNFIHCIDFDDGRHFKLNILDIMPNELIKQNVFVIYGFVREYNNKCINLQTSIPQDIIQLILRFYCVFL